MNPIIESMIREALRPYGADFSDGHIVKPGKSLDGITVKAVKGRMRFEATDGGTLYFSGPVQPKTVASFVERFWCWRIPPGMEGAK